VVHVTLSLLEVTACTSTLCVDNGAFLVAFIAFEFILIIMLSWLAVWLVPGYRRNLKYTLGFGRNDMVMMTRNHDRPNKAEKVYTAPDPSAPAYTEDEGLTVRIETPLLKQMRDAKRGGGGGNGRATAHGHKAK
jgi:hypothetical protein